MFYLCGWGVACFSAPVRGLFDGGCALGFLSLSGAHAQRGGCDLAWQTRSVSKTHTALKHLRTLIVKVHTVLKYASKAQQRAPFLLFVLGIGCRL